MCPEIELLHHEGVSQDEHQVVGLGFKVDTVNRLGKHRQLVKSDLSGFLIERQQGNFV